MLTSEVSAMGVKVVMGEVEDATADEVEGSHGDVAADEPDDPASGR
jgi:hypothetical protein